MIERRAGSVHGKGQRGVEFLAEHFHVDGVIIALQAVVGLAVILNLAGLFQHAATFRTRELVNHEGVLRVLAVGLGPLYMALRRSRTGTGRRTSAAAGHAREQVAAVCDH